VDAFNLLDPVQLTEAIPLSSDMGNALELPAAAPIGTVGTMVEVLELGEAFLVELFGNWVTLQEPAGLVRVEADTPGAFRQTLGVEVVRTDQMQLVAHANPIKLDLYRLLDDMPDTLLPDTLLEKVQPARKSATC
jgi:hypothetical protein